MLIFLLKLAIFLFLVVGVPFIVGCVATCLSGDDDKGISWGMGFFIVMFFVWFFGGMIAAGTTESKWVKQWDTPLSSLTTNTYIKSTTSKSSVSNSTVARYDYYINNNGTYNNYWVNTDVASVKIENGALRLEAYKKVQIPNTFTKYLLPSWEGSEEWSYIFYVDPKYASENLGVNVGK
jgi:hypothetical protein